MGNPGSLASLLPDQHDPPKVDRYEPMYTVCIHMIRIWEVIFPPDVEEKLWIKHKLHDLGTETGRARPGGRTTALGRGPGARGPSHRTRVHAGHEPPAGVRVPEPA